MTNRDLLAFNNARRCESRDVIEFCMGNSKTARKIGSRGLRAFNTATV